MYIGSRLNKDDVLTIYFQDNSSCPVFVRRIGRNRAIYFDPMLAGDIKAEGREPVRVEFVREDAKYEFDARIKHGIMPWNSGQLYLSPVSELRRIQRREYYRLKIDLDAYIRQQLPEDNAGDEEWMNVSTVDISGGGVLLRSPEPLPPQTKVECIICLYEKNRIHVNGEVVDLYEKLGDILPYQIHISFTDISDDVRDKVISFVFREQQRRRWNEANTAL